MCRKCKREKRNNSVSSRSPPTEFWEGEIENRLDALVRTLIFRSHHSTPQYTLAVVDGLESRSHGICSSFHSGFRKELSLQFQFSKPGTNSKRIGSRIFFRFDRCRKVAPQSARLKDKHFVSFLVYLSLMKYSQEELLLLVQSSRSNI